MTDSVSKDKAESVSGKDSVSALAHICTHIIIHTYTMNTHNHAYIPYAHTNSCTRILYTHAHQERKSKPNPSRVVFSHGSCFVSFSLGGYTEEEVLLSTAGGSHASLMDRGGRCLSQ